MIAFFFQLALGADGKNAYASRSEKPEHAEVGEEKDDGDAERELLLA